MTGIPVTSELKNEASKTDFVYINVNIGYETDQAVCWLFRFV